MVKKEKSSGAWVIVVVVAVAFLTIIFTGVNYSQREATKKKCKDNYLKDEIDFYLKEMYSEIKKEKLVEKSLSSSYAESLLE